ncbi:EamA family transporter [Cohnella herbarum]|uniref:EamA family transporter n=1 Tax=Cohnella herbarum TaxID=2728023 RepID=A0A7Z2ZQG7_9BACL|nr:EamA family transporter [Cohnella herbarum]
MFNLAVGLVILSGLAHSVWNLFTKKSINKNVFLWFCQWAAILIFLPFVLVELPTIGQVPFVGWLLLAASMILHGVYILLLAKSYTIGDLSQVFPIIRGTSPLLVPIFGVLLLNESLSLLGWIGIVCIVSGIFLIGEAKGRIFRKIVDKTILIALLVGVMTTSYTIVDKVTLQYFPSFTLNWASNVGNLLALTTIVMRSQGIRQEWKVNWKTILLGGLLAPGSYILFLKALELMPVSQIAPMREIGTVFGTLMGVFILHERQGKGRILASVSITAGIIMLAQT